MNVSSGLEEKVIWEMLQLRKSLPGFFFFLVNMFLINIPFIQAQQRLVGPTGSDTGGWWELPRRPIWAGPVSQCMLHPCQQLGSRSSPSPGHQAALWECRAVGGPCSAGQGCGELETSPAPESLGWKWWPQEGWNIVLGHGQGGVCTELLTGRKTLESTQLHSFSNPFKK